MAISIPLTEYLRDTHIEYDVLKHKATTNAMDTAYSAHIPIDSLAKGVILKDHRGNYLMAAVPCHNRLNLSSLNQKRSSHYNLASESQIKQLFGDCELGAIPACGQPYELETICDDQLLNQPAVYIEAGDHCALLKFKQEQFKQLMANARHDLISDKSHHK
ncbi:MAG: YbaK/EbsC family protein [Motiliproteus sp.]|nr:YbaK/EbsC family protein [Motiliproteus sp.]MCW9053439.1 YbaK/EbsC family protein [Motiliproteus sp.]